MFKTKKDLWGFLLMWVVVLLLAAIAPTAWATPNQNPLRQTLPQEKCLLPLISKNYSQPLTGGMAGKAYLQGRCDHSGVTITVGETGKQGISAADGSYIVADVLPGTYVITAAMPNYLYARRESVTVEEDTIITLPNVTLLAGNPYYDEEIDRLDLLIIDRNFTAIVTPGTNGDIDASGEVDGLDLYWVGRNFTKTAPGPW